MSAPPLPAPPHPIRRAVELVRPAVLREHFVERSGGHPVAADFAPHLDEALAWLARAQDATASGGIARGYALFSHPYFGVRGWEPEYPETTGYIIPTLYMAADHLGRGEFAERALRAARWECDVQLPDGSVRGGVMGQPVSPAVFNTGQVLFGWLAAHAYTGDARFADATVRAAQWLVERLDADGVWRRDTSRFAASNRALYNARTAWALAEAGARLGLPRATAAARRALNTVAEHQLTNGWLPDCCLTNPEAPLLHTLAYAIRGLLEGGRVLGDTRLIARAEVAAAAVARAVEADGRLPGRLDARWTPSAAWSCLTGNAQMANIWLRLAESSDNPLWLDAAFRALRFVASTQNRRSRDPGLRGGIKGSAPMSGEYGTYETLSWATKFFADGVMRYQRLTRRTTRVSLAHPLA